MYTVGCFFWSALEVNHFAPFQIHVDMYCRSTQRVTVVSDSPTRVTTSSNRVPVVPLATHYAGKQPLTVFQNNYY